MKIEMNKKYRTRDGRPVRILCVDRDNINYPVVALTGKEQSITSFTIEGLLAPGANSELNLIDVPPYDHLRVDDKVVVWNKDVKNTDFKEIITELLNNNIDNIQADINSLEPKDRLAFIERLFKYVVPL